MKRFWVALLMSFVLSTTLVACNAGGQTTNDSEEQVATTPDFTANFVGVWQLDNGVFDGDEMSSDVAASARENGFGVYLVLNEDGTGRFISFYESDPTYEADDIAFEWKATGSMAATILENDELEETELTLSGGQIVMTEDEDNFMRFTKSSQEEMDQVRANGVAAAASSSTSTSSSSFTGDLVDYYENGTYGFGFYAPANPDSSSQEADEIRLYYSDPEFWVLTGVVEDEADALTTEENANYYVEYDDATIEYIEDGLVCLSGLDDDGDQYYMLIATKDNDNIYLEVFYHPADDELMFPIAQAILGSLEF